MDRYSALYMSNHLMTSAQVQDVDRFLQELFASLARCSSREH